MMIRIRMAVPDDAAELMAMNREFNGVDDISEDDVRAELAQGGELVAVADAGECLAGYCCAQKHKSFCYKNPVAELTAPYSLPAGCAARHGRGRGEGADGRGQRYGTGRIQGKRICQAG